MKTPDEIKKGLECCYSSVEPVFRCEECPYHGSIVCKMHLHTDNLAYVQQLEAELSDAKSNHQHTIDIAEKQKEQIDKLKKVIVRLNKERDAAVENMRSDPQCCHHCKHHERGGCDSIPQANAMCFEWRGVKEE